MGARARTPSGAGEQRRAGAFAGRQFGHRRYVELSALARALEHALARATPPARPQRRAGTVQRYGRRDPPPAAPVCRRFPAPGGAGTDGATGAAREAAAGSDRRAARGAAVRSRAMFEALPALADAADVEGAAVEPTASLAAIGRTTRSTPSMPSTRAVPIFEEEADELLPQLQARLRECRAAGGAGRRGGLPRTLHTYKGGRAWPARCVWRNGAPARGRDRGPGRARPRLGRRCRAAAGPRGCHGVGLRHPAQGARAALPTRRRRCRKRRRARPPRLLPRPGAGGGRVAEPGVAAAPTAEMPAEAVAGSVVPAAAALPAIRLAALRRREAAAVDPAAAAAERPAVGTAVVRVRASLLDRLVNQAGEVSITRAASRRRGPAAGLAVELTESLDRMRRSCATSSCRPRRRSARGWRPPRSLR